MRTAFNIPAINNPLEALAKHLGVDSEDIKEQVGGMFAHRKLEYRVIPGLWGVGDSVHFNNSYWTVISRISHHPLES